VSWLTATIGDVCLATSQIDPARTGDGSFRYVDISGIDRETKSVARADTVLCSAAPSRARRRIQTNDVLVSTVRPNLNAVAIVPEELNHEIASTGFAVIRANPKLAHAKYIFYRAQHPEFIDFLVANATGASYPAVSEGTVKRAPLPLPVLKEQHRIIELLDEADHLRTLRREADAKAARILPALFLKMFGTPASWLHSDNISMEPLGRLVSIQSGGTPSKANPEFWKGQIPWVSPKDMKRDFLEDAEDHISELAVKGSATRIIDVHSILVVVRGMILARYVPMAMALRPVAINQDIKALTVIDQRVTPLFVFGALKTLSSGLFAEVNTAAHGTKKLETSRLESILVPIPSRTLVDKFTNAFKEMILLDSQRESLAPRIDQLFSLLLSRAFSGQLTARWRETNMKALLAEMKQQARFLELPQKEAASA
jgi:type I restriction enzyme S subunit